MADCIGFSVQRRYPASCRYKPPVKRNGEPDTLALIVVVYQPDRRDPNKPYLVPIVARVSVYNRYVAKHLDYDFTDDECPTEESVVASNKTPRPIELSSINDYFFDHNNDRFLGADTKVIDGIDIIDGLFKLHLATVDKLKGAIFRWRLNNINRKARCYGLVLGIFKWLLKLSCGQTLESDNMGKGILDKYRREDMKLLKTESIEIFGYKASRNTICTFCSLLLIAFVFFRIVGAPRGIKTIAGNNFLGIAACILSISLLDWALPRIFLVAINLVIKARLRSMAARIKFK